jgi:hypothetical protein
MSELAGWIKRGYLEVVIVLFRVIPEVGDGIAACGFLFLFGARHAG